ncbi:unnamed protein product [Dibothriocephalus latus]|uniref:BPTI/Kunitz inhibitor domain-containing protein n=1 Tax=Dibothriocephalus latus TaxID=60516 RepID=A0A3P6Q3A9_DIBLA|nr:unnamed protein product [Dibothriocephalus latus]
MLILLLLSSVAVVSLGTVAEAAESVCNLPLDKGEQSVDWGAKYGYNPDEKICELFNYGGKGGNANRFETMEECEKASRLCFKRPPENVCNLPLDKGEQSVDWGAQYGYNPDEKICETFNYGGKGGNANRFESRTECEEATKHCPQRGRSKSFFFFSYY